MIYNNVSISLSINQLIITLGCSNFYVFIPPENSTESSKFSDTNSSEVLAFVGHGQPPWVVGALKMDSADSPKWRLIEDGACLFFNIYVLIYTYTH